MGKGLGGGLPVSAAIGPADIMNFATSFSMQTLHGNPICAAAANVVLNTIDAENLLENASKTGCYLTQSLRQLMQTHEQIGDVRGRGLTVGVELVTTRQGKEPASQAAAKLVYRSFELGLVHYYVGMNSNVLELTPSLNITEPEVDEAVAIMGKALEDTVAGRVSDSVLEGFEGW